MGKLKEFLIIKKIIGYIVKLKCEKSKNKFAKYEKIM